MREQLAKIVEILNNHGDYWAELGGSYYLIRFGRRDEDNNNLVLMHDLGITWEPNRAYPTPRYCSITIEDAEQAAKNLMKIADTRKRGELPAHCEDDYFQHLVDD